MASSVLEVIYKLSVSHFLFADVADALGEILAEPCLRFCQLLLEVIIYVCHMLSDFFPLVLLFCSLTEGMFLLFQRAGSHQ